MIFLLVTSFFSTFIFSIKIKPHINLWRDHLVIALLIFSGILVFITEVLSSIFLFNNIAIGSFWFVYSSLAFLLILKYKNEFTIYFKNRINYYNNEFLNTNKNQKIILFFILLLLSGIIFQGILYPPNNGDSMTYHMARIPHWINNGSVEHFATSIPRQLYQPPFAEFLISHIILLSSSDLFANAVQFIYLLFSLILISLIAKKLLLNRKSQLYSVLFAVTIPEAILQGSSTQNDIVVSFFILSSIYYVIKIFKEKSLFNYMIVGVSAGLALLTKGTAYIYLFPPLLLLFFISCYYILIKKQFNTILYGTIAIVIICIINTGHYSRNYTLTSDILGVTEQEKKLYTNNDLNLKSLISNIIRNVANHTGSPVSKDLMEVGVLKLHTLLKIQVNNPKTTWGKWTIEKRLNTHEDYAANLIQLIMAIISVCILVFYLLRKSNSANFILIFITTILFLQFIIFCYYLKWQPWHTRLHTPMWFLLAPVIIFIFNIINHKINLFFLLLSVAYSIFILLFNYTRPLITNWYWTSEINVFDDRYKKYFANQLHLYEDYKKVKDQIDTNINQHIGLILGSSDYEYPLFNDFSKDRAIPHHITAGTTNHEIKVNQIISTIRQDSIKYNNQWFLISDPNNKHLFIYMRRIP